MADRRLSVTAAAIGVSAGLAPYLPTAVCAGGACTSCFACVGAGGAAAAALVAGFVSRKFGKASPSEVESTPAIPEEGGIPD